MNSKKNLIVEPESFPRVTKTLLEALKEFFPKKNYSPDDTSNFIFHEEGKQFVINFLEKIKEEQEYKKILKS